MNKEKNQFSIRHYFHTRVYISEILNREIILEIPLYFGIFSKYVMKADYSLKLNIVIFNWSQFKSVSNDNVAQKPNV